MCGGARKGSSFGRKLGEKLSGPRWVWTTAAYIERVGTPGGGESRRKGKNHWPRVSKEKKMAPD